MTITLSAETEALLLKKARREGADANRVAEELLSAVLQWEQEQREMMEGIQRGLEDSRAGRVRSFAEFASEMREKYALPVHLSDAEIGSVS